MRNYFFLANYHFFVCPMFTMLIWWHHDGWTSSWWMFGWDAFPGRSLMSGRAGGGGRRRGCMKKSVLCIQSATSPCAKSWHMCACTLWTVGPPVKPLPPPPGNYSPVRNFLGDKTNRSGNIYKDSDKNKQKLFWGEGGREEELERQNSCFFFLLLLITMGEEGAN